MSRFDLRTRTGQISPIIQGVTPVSYLLDLYPNSLASYSLRLLRNEYSGSAIRVRRSSDNTETDIGFTSSGILNTSALLTFCGAGNGFVTIWYDQSGNGKNATQTTAANQPLIVSSGVVLRVNGNPSIVFDGTDFLTNTQTLTYGDFSLFMTTQYNSGLVFVQYSKLDMAVLNNFVQSSDTGIAAIATYAQSIIGNQQKLHTHLSTLSGATTTSTLYVNGTQRATGTRNLLATKTTLAISATDIGSIPSNQSMQEIVLYASNQLSNKTNIESNIISFYSIS